jgi:D-lactate dehydrogenase (cytochrome)
MDTVGTSLDASLLEGLRKLLGDRLSVNETERVNHGMDESSFPPAAPDAVAFLGSTEEASELVRLCAEHDTPVIPFGAGTSLEGHVLATRGGVAVVMTGMDRILEVNVEDLDATVQAGVTRKQLNDGLRDHGLFFPVDPGADASIGGMASTRASGTTAVRYGTMRDNVLALTVVLADGRIIRTGTRARKSSAGYDLTRLFVGSEGTLGLITEVTVRLQGVPPAISSAICRFPTIDQAVDTVISTIQFGIPIARVELLDEPALEAVNAFSGLDCALEPTLFLEFHGSDAGVVEQAQEVQELARNSGGTDFEWATRTEERNRLWQARHDAYWAALASRPGCRSITTDVCVPISRLGECIGETKADIAEGTLNAPLVGHVGDGNFHLTILVEPGNEEELREASELNGRLIRRALSMGGTCTGEHGVGYGKMGYLVEEHGEAIDTMRTIKVALDPNGIMNPGKVIDVGEAARDPAATGSSR